MPPPDIDTDPLGYASYVVKDLRELVVDASPGEVAIVRRLDLIKDALLSLTSKIERTRDDRRKMVAAIVGAWSESPTAKNAGEVFDAFMFVADSEGDWWREALGLGPAGEATPSFVPGVSVEPEPIRPAPEV